MSIENDPTDLQAVTRTSQIIVGALTMGVISFMAIVLLLLNEPPHPPQGVPAASRPPVITYVAVAFGASILVASFVVPRLVVDSGLRGLVKTGASTAAATGDAGAKQIKPSVAAHELLPLFQTQLIIGAALAEGGAFFATIAYMLEHQYLALGVAAALLAVLLSKFPTVDRVEGWLDDKMSRLGEMRTAGW